MAEQISHNVVDYIESTSGSPLVDVAANQTTAASADYGTNDYTTKNNTLQTSQNANELASEANELISNPASELTATDSAAKPSAGIAAVSVATAGQEPLINGVNEVPTLVDGIAEDTGVREGSVDVSINSDTEGSRGDASEVKKDDDKHHVRTNSVKKPTTFSKVSATKNFLQKSASTTPTGTKPNDKPSPVGTPPQPSAAKPRLVAKMGTSLSNVQKARAGTEGSGGPDASKVWNKNRPVPPPPPKQFTDEELKQQYGIHLATRLQSSETGKESKWADIDDEEEDWAPETVEWMDGTKSTLAPQESTPVQNEQKPTSPQPTKPAEAPKPTLLARKPTELGPTKTILKPGAIAAAAQAKQSGPDAGLASDKLSLKSKSPAPAPTKSPWAALPPVDKVSPINPPVQQQQAPPLLSQDARAYEQPLQPPAREIAADTFDRSWREGEGGTRELFNSVNGRYEPAPEGRRSSAKPDSVYRKPSVLQRPSPQPGAPAEPSAAFQSRTTSQTDGSWGRRRGSSVSGSQGSIPPARRMSVSKGQEISPAPERRSSTVIGHDMRLSPRAARNEPAQPVFAQQSAWQQQMPPQPEPGAEEEDPLKTQERVMREKRELAKKRRQEEEERAEAEKQERLKARLAALEGAGKSRKEREAEAAALAAKSPSSEKPSENAVVSPMADEALTQPVDTTPVAAQVQEAQSLSSAPDSHQEKQPSPEEKLPSPLPPKPQVTGLPDRPGQSAEQDPRQQSRPHLSPRSNARLPFQQQASAYRPSTSAYSSPGERKQQPLGRSPLQSNDAFSPWPTTAPNSNVWGTAGIGNGTFQSANGFAPMPMSQQSSALPPPPGMTRPSPSNRVSPLAGESRSPSLQQQSVPEPARGFAPPGLDSQPDSFANSGRVNGVSPAPGFGRQPHAPGPIAPPSRQHNQHQQQPVQRPEAIAAWNKASQTLPSQFANDAEAAENRPKQAGPTAPREDVYKETFKQTATNQGKLGDPRKYKQPEYTIHDAQGSRSVQSFSPAPPNAQTQPSGPSAVQQWQSAAENTVRIPDGSLNPAHGGLSAQLSPIGPPSTTQSRAVPPHVSANYRMTPLPAASEVGDQSPPPPESSSHPAFSGDVGHPLVKLPKKAIVKLPPPASPVPQQQTPVMIPHRPVSNWGPPGSARPIVMQEAWQARFNGLFNRTAVPTETPPSPPKTPPKMHGPAPPVAASSRTVMDEAPAARGATVSLPQTKRLTSAEGFTLDDSSDAVSKSMIEHMFNEELSFGSKPIVSIPRNAFYDHDVYGTANRYQGTNLKAAEAAEARSLPEFSMVDLHPVRRDGYFVHLPQTKLIRKLVGSNKPSRKPSALHQERKSSGKFNKTRAKESTPPTSTSASTPNGNVRKASTQKTSTPESNSTATVMSPVSEGVKKTSWPKPPKGPPRQPRTTVKPT